jgi:hypothetical protein
MTTNISNLDRAFRVWIGMLLLATPLLELPTSPYFLIGLIPLVTGLIGFCPLYRLFGRVSLHKATPVVALPPASNREIVRHAAGGNPKGRSHAVRSHHRTAWCFLSELRSGDEAVVVRGILDRESGRRRRKRPVAVEHYGKLVRFSRSNARFVRARMRSVRNACRVV